MFPLVEYPCTSGYPWSNPIRLNNFSYELGLIGIFFNRFEHEAPKYKVTGEAHEQREIECKVYKSKEAGYEPEGLEYEGDEVHKLGELVYNDDSLSCLRRGE